MYHNSLAAQGLLPDFTVLGLSVKVILYKNLQKIATGFSKQLQPVVLYFL